MTRFQTNEQTVFFFWILCYSGIFQFLSVLFAISPLHSEYIFAFVPTFVFPFLKRAPKLYNRQSSLMMDPWLAAVCKGGWEMDLLTMALGVSPSSLSGVGGHWLSRSEAQPSSGKAQKQIRITKLRADLGFGGPKYTQK